MTGSNGVVVTLRPVRWEFGPHAKDEDREWLVISCTIDPGDRSWSFTDACLLIKEARELAGWLRDAAQGRIEPDRVGIDEQPEATLSFLEPALGFSLTVRREHEYAVRLHLSAEGAPPWLHNDVRWTQQHVVEVHLRPNRLLAAANRWTEELDALRARPEVDPGS